MKIIVTDKGEEELTRLGFDIHSSIKKILNPVPGKDLLQLSHISITDVPSQKDSRRTGALGVYKRKWKNYQACIEISLKNIFPGSNKNTFNKLLLLKELGLARVLYHEIGHHVEKTLSHGIKKTQREKFAEDYMTKLFKLFLLENKATLKEFFNVLKDNHEKIGLTLEELNEMKTLLPFITNKSS